MNWKNFLFSESNGIIRTLVNIPVHYIVKHSAEQIHINLIREIISFLLFSKTFVQFVHVRHTDNVQLFEHIFYFIHNVYDYQFINIASEFVFVAA